MLPNRFIQKVERHGPLTEEEMGVMASAPSWVVKYEPRQDDRAPGLLPVRKQPDP